MSPLLAAIGREEIADYVSALFLVYLVMIFVRILLSWVQMFRPIPYNVYLRGAVGFVEETTDPYLNIFRRVIPPIGGRLDLSPMLAVILLLVVQGIVVGAIRG